MDWLEAGDHSIAHLFVARGVALIYLMAFANALNQFPTLLGEKGLLPVPAFVARAPFAKTPSLFHWRYSDALLRAVAWVGILVSAAALIGLLDEMPVWAWMVAWLVLWALYQSIVNVGQVWYGFGLE